MENSSRGGAPDGRRYLFSLHYLPHLVRVSAARRLDSDRFTGASTEEGAAHGRFVRYLPENGVGFLGPDNGERLLAVIGLDFDSGADLNGRGMRWLLDDYYITQHFFQLENACLIQRLRLLRFLIFRVFREVAQSLGRLKARGYLAAGHRLHLFQFALEFLQSLGADVFRHRLMKSKVKYQRVKYKWPPAAASKILHFYF